MEFTFVYIKEAHPDDEWQMKANEDAEVIFDQPDHFDQRMDLAQTFVSAMDVGTRTLVDDMANTVDNAYAGWPERLFVVENGVIAYAGGQGPFGFEPDALARWLRKNIGRAE